MAKITMPTFDSRAPSRWCIDCDGDGKNFECLGNDPSERPEWRTCRKCNGTGERPVVVLDETEIEDEQH